MASKALVPACTCFNPRICKRCDVVNASIDLLGQVSIHASVKDATVATVLSDQLVRFNPRICKRCDAGGTFEVKTLDVSIHASVKDATL